MRQKIHADLKNLPNYLCTETINQWRIKSSGCSAAPCEPEELNRFRLDVGYLQGRQIFGWPGGESLSESDVSRLVGGQVTDGDLVALARLLLLSKPIITGERHQDRDGRATIRYEYSVPRETSGWLVGYPNEQRRVAYRGSFQVDTSSLDVVELTMIAESLPAGWDIQAIDRTLQYTRTPIGLRDFLLPDRAVLLAKDREGNTIKTEARFNACRQYAAESSLHFPVALPAGRLAAPKASRSSDRLERDLIAEVVLQTEIDSDHAAVGDPFAATLQRDLGRRQKRAIASHSVLHGRISRLELVKGERQVDIAFNYLEIDGVRIDIRERRNQLVWNSGSEWVPATLRSSGPRIQLPRGQIFFFRSVADRVVK